ncbi:PEP-CTERM sorting domain-containing protein [Stieleria neptunia]|nr:PEP-CTERM sorting domain-containing protein [Stieleria neptunia]
MIFVASQANAGVMTFTGQSGNLGVSVYVEDGVRFATPGDLVGVDPNSIRPTAPAGAAYSGIGGGVYEISLADSSSFDLVDFLYYGNTNTGSGLSFDVTGFLTGGGTVAASITDPPLGDVPLTFSNPAFVGLDLIRVAPTSMVDFLLLDNIHLEPAAAGTVPEPTSIAIFACGVICMVGARRRRRA